MSAITSTVEYLPYTMVHAMMYGGHRAVRTLVIGSLTAITWEPTWFKWTTTLDFNWFNSHFALQTVDTEKLGAVFEIVNRPVKVIGFGRFNLLRFGPKNPD